MVIKMGLIEESYKDLESMMQATRAILEFESFEKSARIIFDEARKLTKAKAGYIALLSENGDENEVLFLEAGGDDCTVDPKLPMPIRGLRADAYNLHKAVYHNDFMNSEHVKFMPAGHVVMTNVMFSPLIVDGKVVGVMGLANKPMDFTPHDAKIATAYGEFAAIALKNSYTLDELRYTVEKLEHSLDEIKKLKGLLPICSHCKNIRDDKGYWHQVEEYMQSYADVSFTHSLCPECVEKYYSEFKITSKK